ncbi:MAG: hypothetical protein JNJ57_11055 [Saprospiraceae bacterium]|nr:hypothetical protein [Saprospiraceae bacterium]
MNQFAKTIKFRYRFLLPAVVALTTFFACENSQSCKYKPSPVFEKGLPHVTEYNFEQQGTQSLESLLLDRGILLEISQEVCNQSRQEYRFTVPGDYAALPDSFWMKEASRQFVYLSSFSEKQAPLKAWGDIIELRRGDMRLGEDREVQPGVFVRVDRVVNSQQGILLVVLSQKGE